MCVCVFVWRDVCACVHVCVCVWANWASTRTRPPQGRQCSTALDKAARAPSRSQCPRPDTSENDYPCISGPKAAIAATGGPPHDYMAVEAQGPSCSGRAAAAIASGRACT